MWPLRTLFYFTYFWVACLCALVNPIYGVLNYMLVYQTNPVNTWWGVPLVNLGLRFSMLAAIFTTIGIVVGRKYVPKVKPLISYWELGIVGIVVIAALGLIINPIGRESTFAFEKLWKMMVFVLILGRLATTRKNLKLVIWSFVAGTLFIGHEAYYAPASSYYLGRLEVIGGPDFSSTSGAAAHLAAMLPLVGTAFLIATKWRWRVFALMSGAFAFNAIILCRTRSAFIGLVFGFLAAVIFAPSSKRYRIHALLALGIISAFSLTDNHFWNRMSTLTNEQALNADPAAVSRFDIWNSSFNILHDHPAGVGPGNFPVYIGRYDPRYYNRSSHNTLLVCFVDLGIQGGLVFCMMIMLVVWYLVQCLKLAKDTHAPTETRYMAYGMLISFITYFVTGLGTERFYCESYWWVLTLPLCLYRTVLSEVAERKRLPATQPELSYREPEITWKPATAL